MVSRYRNKIAQARDLCFTTESLRQNVIVSIKSFSDEVDGMLREIYEEHFNSQTEAVCLIALGGYGRRELCPWSDIDILILCDGDHKQDCIARFVRALWDTGFPLGCVVRSISECKKILGEDLATDTAFLDSRYLAGNRNLFKILEISVIVPYFKKRGQRFTQDIDAAIYASIEAAEISLFTVEPDLKNGICTLRDCHRIRWARRVAEKNIIWSDSDQDCFLLADGEQLICNAFLNLLSIRCALHCAAGRRIDVLEFGFQLEISECLGFGKKNPELLMERYFRTVSDIKVAILFYLEQKRESRPFHVKLRSFLSSIKITRGVWLLDGILWGTKSFQNEGHCSAAWLMDLFFQALSYRAAFSNDLICKIHSFVENLTREELLQSEASSSFIKILSSQNSIEPVIRVMHETGVLEKLIPEFESIRFKVEYDSYHEFTVDQHTLLALYTLDNLRYDSEYCSLYESVNDLCTLRLAILLHDIGKSIKGGEHCYNGAVMVSTICDRLEVDELRKNNIIKLVLNHLELSKLTFQREPEIDILKAFAQTIGTVNTLDMLYLLTIVDIKSVGRKSWTGWKGMQLQSIHEKIRMLIDGKIPVSSELHLLSGEKVQNITRNIDSSNDLAIKLELFPEYERLTFCTIDRQRLFADIVGCISSEGYNILNAQIMTTDDCKAIDIFTVEPDTTTRIPSEKRIDNIRKKWEKIMSGTDSADKFIADRTRLYPLGAIRKADNLKISVKLDNSISREYSVIEIHSNDRTGILYKIALVFTNLNINVVSAKLSTRGTHIADVFYVNSQSGKKIEENHFDSEIKLELLGILN